MTDLREKLKAIRDTGNVWARNLVQAMDEAVKEPRDAGTIPRALKFNAFMMEREIRGAEPFAEYIEPTEIAQRFGLQPYTRTPQ